MTALVHLAAPPIRAGDVIRQRCGWCGALIEELDLTRTAVQIQPGETEDDARRSLVADDGTPAPGWAGLVAVDVCEGVVTAKWAVPDPEDGQIPADSCMNLDPGATA
jgi:hypothetical protein